MLGKGGGDGECERYASPVALLGLGSVAGDRGFTALRFWMYRWGGGWYAGTGATELSFSMKNVCRACHKAIFVCGYWGLCLCGVEGFGVWSV